MLARILHLQRPRQGWGTDDEVEAGGAELHVFLPIGIGGGLTTPPLPHHRTSGSAYGGSIG
jgi:hypothetical protein